MADYRGLKVSEIGAVRRSLREKGIHYHVVKNRLAKIAADQAGVTELSALLEGPTAIAVGIDDESQLAKAFLDAVRPYKVVVVRGGVIRGRRIEASDVTRLAELPSREVLLAQLAGAIASPLSTMAGLLVGAHPQPRRRPRPARRAEGRLGRRLSACREPPPTRPPARD